jgi:hypothetical protein
MKSHDHLGTRFQVWNGQQTWFWSIFDTGRNRGTIGAAASETQAMREACSMIEEWSLQADRSALFAEQPWASRPTGDFRASGSRSCPIVMAETGWAISLEKLERYLNVCGAAA